MKVLVACEYSGRVRDAFRENGHDAYSCDLLPTESTRHDYQQFHFIQDVSSLLQEKWDLMIAFPPCTYLCMAGIRWNTNNPERQEQTRQAVEFFKMLLNAPIDRIAVENPVGVIPRRTGIKWTQMIHPWQFGHAEEKKTCLWLKNLPPLMPTQIMEERKSKMWFMSPSPDRSKKRSLTYSGIAQAMADQWGNLPHPPSLASERGV